MLRPASDTAATLAVYGAALDTPAAAFTCAQSRGGKDEARLHIAGELDAATAPRLQRTLQAVQEATPHVVVDLRDVTFIGMAGARTIAAAGDRARRAGNRLVVVSGTYAARVFALAGKWDGVEFRDTDSDPADTPAAVPRAGRSARYRSADDLIGRADSELITAGRHSHRQARATRTGAIPRPHGTSS